MTIPKTKKNDARKTDIKCFFNLDLPLLLIVIWNKKMFLELYPVYNNFRFVLGLNFIPKPKLRSVYGNGCSFHDGDITRLSCKNPLFNYFSL